MRGEHYVIATELKLVVTLQMDGVVLGTRKQFIYADNLLNFIKKSVTEVGNLHKFHNTFGSRASLVGQRRHARYHEFDLYHLSSLSHSINRKFPLIYCFRPTQPPP